MRKKKHAVAAVMTAVVMLCPLFQAQAAETAGESVTINLSELDVQAEETVSITEDGYRIGDTSYVYDGNYIFTGTWQGELSGDDGNYDLDEFRSVIAVEKDVDADITFQDVVIKTTGGMYANPVRIAGDSTGDVTITLKGENYLECNNGGGAAALQKSSIKELENAGTLTLRCEFSGQKGHVCGEACGSLKAVSQGGSGIGAQSEYIHGNRGEMNSAALSSLHIEGGNIEAVCGRNSTSAAIGTGSAFSDVIMTETGEVLHSADVGLAASEMIQDLVISGGNVYAHGELTPAALYTGIGMGGVDGDNTTAPSHQTANITISGGTVRAVGSSGMHMTRGEFVASGIGQYVSGYDADRGFHRPFNIAITGGTVTVKANPSDRPPEYPPLEWYGIDAHELTISGGSVTEIQGSGIFAEKLAIGENSPVIRTSAVAGDTSYETDSGTQGIVFVGNTGTVYGNVVLNDEQIIADDETLTIPESASLTNNSVLTVNGRLINKGRFRNNGSFQYGDGEFICVSHVLMETAEQPATHLKPGNICYYSCEHCGRIYRDAAGTQEISLADTELDKITGHTPDGSGWHSDENNHWNKCECGEVIHSAPHSFVWITDKEATTTEKGSKHEECSACGYTKAAVEIPIIESTAPTEPENPDTPSKPDENTNAPQTGDRSGLAIWITLLAPSGIGLAGTIVFGKKRYSIKSR